MRSSVITSLALATQLSSQVLGQNVPISAALYNTLVRYTRFSAASYADNCAKPFTGSVVTYFSDAATDAQATLFRDDSAREIIIAFRGTSTPQDFQTDVIINRVPLTAVGTSCSTCLVHQGFQQSWNALSSAVVAAINTQQTQHPGYSLTVTGHSLGGAIAAIASSSLVGLGKTITTYTFGEPRNGDSAYTTYVNGLVPNYYRVTHANDGVPQVLNAAFGFQHHGTEYWESAAGNGNSASTTFLCPGIDPTTCNAAQAYNGSFINAAHISYSDMLIGNSLFIVPCGAVYP